MIDTILSVLPLIALLLAIYTFFISDTEQHKNVRLFVISYAIYVVSSIALAIQLLIKAFA